MGVEQDHQAVTRKAERLAQARHNSSRTIEIASTKSSLQNACEELYKDLRLLGFPNSLNIRIDNDENWQFTIEEDILNIQHAWKDESGCNFEDRFEIHNSGVQAFYVRELIFDGSGKYGDTIIEHAEKGDFENNNEGLFGTRLNELTTFVRLKTDKAEALRQAEELLTQQLSFEEIYGFTNNGKYISQIFHHFQKVLTEQGWIAPENGALKDFKIPNLGYFDFRYYEDGDKKEIKVTRRIKELGIDEEPSTDETLQIVVSNKGTARFERKQLLPDGKTGTDIGFINRGNSAHPEVLMNAINEMVVSVDAVIQYENSRNNSWINRFIRLVKRKV